ncbi:MAG TPA: hypothetical protein P5137_02810 [Candidatus Brocadiia bacterium]|nr:hypothetical protein [Candidatus Brocadiia bacterium]
MPDIGSDAAVRVKPCRRGGRGDLLAHEREVEPVITRTIAIGDAGFTFIKFDLPRPALRARLADALAECDRAAGLGNVLRQTFFVAEGVNPAEIAGVVERGYGRPAPVTSYVRQNPADGHALSCEIWAFTSPYPVHRGARASWVCTPAATWGFVGGAARGGRAGPSGEDVRRMLDGAQRGLRLAGLDFAHMVRTWYYIGGLLGPAAQGSRYDEFNAARNAFYKDKWPDLLRTPASTGIGMAPGEVVFDGLVVKPESDNLEISWLDNPLQTPPYLYDIRAEQVRKPSFSRGAAVKLGDAQMTFISGTASIRQSRVLHADDVAAQTETTIENISALLGGASLDDLQLLRVYVKRPRDVEIVRDCCRGQLPDAPCAYLIADVCRPDCLVEIEGVHFAASVPAEALSGAGAPSAQGRQEPL